MPHHDPLTSAAGVRMPRIIYGTAWKKAETERLVATALRLGFRGIDTAAQPKHYDEAGVGAGIAACLGEGLSRNDLYLQTKFTPPSGQDPNRIPYDPNASVAAQVAQSFQSSLRNLRTDYIDCLVLHSPVRGTETWRAMEALVDTGGARQLGISNCYDLATFEQLHRSTRHKPAVLQNRFYAETGYDRALRGFCREHGVVYQSFWTLSANPQVLAHRSVQAVAAKYGRTPAQVLYCYLTQIGVVPLTGTRSEAHMRQGLAISEFELDAEELQAMDMHF
jgi:diketogulonate reductase-like aldo/keto reductase